jgi:hypothetical protein
MYQGQGNTNPGRIKSQLFKVRYTTFVSYVLSNRTKIKLYGNKMKNNIHHKLPNLIENRRKMYN